MSAAVLPGWYGKLPSLGDFAGRRLPPLFVEPWDRWLATGLASWRQSDEAWLDAFLAAPTWRFALGAGVPFKQSPGYAGVLMPSVDRVGRYFPLTVVRPRGPREERAPAVWLHALEGSAVAALNGDWDAERFDAELGALDDAADTGPVWPAEGRTLWWCERDGELSTPIAATGLPEVSALVRALARRTGSIADDNLRAEP
jgi:type VI secretion system ImpM family protein